MLLLGYRNPRGACFIEPIGERPVDEHKPEGESSARSAMNQVMDSIQIRRRIPLTAMAYAVYLYYSNMSSGTPPSP